MGHPSQLSRCRSCVIINYFALVIVTTRIFAAAFHHHWNNRITLGSLLGVKAIDYVAHRCEALKENKTTANAINNLMVSFMTHSN